MFHPRDPIDEQVDLIVRTRTEKIADGYGEVTRAQLEKDSTVGSSALMVHQPNTVSLVGRTKDKLCFAQNRNVGGADGMAAARARAKEYYDGAHYQYLFFRDLNEAKAKRPWPKMDATQPIEFRADAATGVEGETYQNSSGETRKYQDSVDVLTTFCGASPVVPSDAKWFALVLIHRHDQEERDRVMLWEIKDAAPPQDAASPAE